MELKRTHVITSEGPFKNHLIVKYYDDNVPRIMDLTLGVPVEYNVVKHLGVRPINQQDKIVVTEEGHLKVDMQEKWIKAYELEHGQYAVTEEGQIIQKSHYHPEFLASGLRLATEGVLCRLIDFDKEEIVISGEGE
jgi:hypothetical protein